MTRIKVIFADLLLLISISIWIYLFKSSEKLLWMIIPIILTLPVLAGCIKMHFKYFTLTKRIY